MLHLLVEFTSEINKQNQITGYLWQHIYVDDKVEKGIYQSCYLYFKGEYVANQDSIKILVFDTFNKNPISNGSLFLDNSNLEVNLRVNKFLISCQNMFDLTGGEVFKLTKNEKILYCAKVKTAKAFFYNNGILKRSYLVKGNFINVLDDADKVYLKIQYIDKRSKTIQGWVKKSDVE